MIICTPNNTLSLHKSSRDASDRFRNPSEILEALHEFSEDFLLDLKHPLSSCVAIQWRKMNRVCELLLMSPGALDVELYMRKGSVSYACNSPGFGDTASSVSM